MIKKKIIFQASPRSSKEYLSTKDAAHYLGISYQFLEIARSHGGGPPFIKLARMVRYKLSDLDDWMEAHRRNNTSEKV